MKQSRFPRHGGFLIVLTALVFLLTLPALALFHSGEKASDGIEGAPIAENLSLTTYKNVAIDGTFSAVDREGDLVTFRITRNPARGEVTFAAEGSAQFTYIPYENKTGKDSFTYVAEDLSGHTSPEATVSIRIQKPDTKVTYSDMNGNSAHKAAIALAERDIFVGERMGDTWFFQPDTPVTREEFLAMAMDTVGLETLGDVSATGFSDDDSISVWAKPYVASALKSGMVQGSQNAAGKAVFQPDSPMTQTQAAVLLNRLLRVSDVTAEETVEQAAPAWACQSVANLKAVGVLEPDSSGSLSLSNVLTRGEAAKMLSSALEVLDFRETTW